jgi:hypothetical protein
VTLSDSELRAMRRALAEYSDDKLVATMETKRLTMTECLETCPDIMDDDNAIVQEYHRAQVVFNAAMDERDRRRDGKTVESLPGMDRLSTSTHTMNGR